MVDEKEFITVVNSAKILGITLCNDLKWNVVEMKLLRKPITFLFFGSAKASWREL